MRSATPLRALVAGLIVLWAGVSVTASDRVKTPFQLVPLWSDEMLAYLIGTRQAACSGVNADTCERLNTGICDGVAHFKIVPSDVQVEMPFRMPARQTASANPQYFELQLPRAHFSYVTRLFEYSRADLDAMEIVFGCNFSGNDACPAARLQTGSVHRIELGVLGGDPEFDLTRLAKVLPDGPIVVPIDRTLREALFRDPRSVYQVRAVAECFSVAPQPSEWTLPAYALPNGVDRVGAVIVRVTPGRWMEFVYRSMDGKDVPFEPDWVEQDWGYTFLMDQTILDRSGDWFQLPPRPFPTAVWIQLPGRKNISRLEVGQIYSVSKKMKAHPKGAPQMVTLDEGGFVVLDVRDRVLEVRKEEPFDTACNGEKPVPGQELQTYLVDVAEVYDEDLHLRLQLAYPKGC